MPPHPLISIIIPFYKDAATIERATRSVLRQSHSDWELIIVDDGSPEAVPTEIVAMVGDRLRIVRHETNRGAAAARNTGIEASRGDYVAFLDADDSWRDSKLEQQMTAMARAGGSVAASVTGFALYRGTAAKPELYCPDLSGPLIDHLVWGCKVSPGSTLLARRACFADVGLYDMDLRRLEDWDWLLRFARHHRMIALSDVLADVYVSGVRSAVNLPYILDATEKLKGKHLAAIAKMGWIRRLKFLSTLVVERAAAYSRAGDRLTATALVIQAMMIWPFQKPAFLRQLWSACRPWRSVR